MASPTPDLSFSQLGDSGDQNSQHFAEAASALQEAVYTGEQHFQQICPTMAQELIGSAAMDPHQMTGEEQDGGRGDGTKSPSAELKAKALQGKKGQGGQHRAGSGAGGYMEEGGEGGGQQQGSGRKKRSRATPAEDGESNGRKSATDASLRENSLWPGGEGEGPVQGSLLEEVLAEKRMALMRSPEVMQFLQQRQLMIQAAHNHSALVTHQPRFSVGEVEEDANS